jgi:hypothetical protein
MVGTASILALSDAGLDIEYTDEKTKLRGTSPPSAFAIFSCQYSIVR